MMFDRVAPSWLTKTALFLLLTALWLVLNPFWYGDAVWYATELQQAAPLFNDPGHLYWRPLGALFLQATELLHLSLDPLLAFRMISALGGTLCCLATFRLARNLSLSPLQSLAAAAMTGSSHFMLAYAGSGSSYSLSLAFATLAYIPLARAEGWKWRELFLAAFWMVCAWCLWGVSILLLPGLMVLALLTARGGILRRLSYPVALAGAVGFALAALALGSFTFLAPRGDSAGLATWLSASSHGIPLNFSPLSVARAALGCLITFLSAGDFGFGVKQLIFGGLPEAMRGEFFLFGALLLLFASLLAVALLGCVRIYRRERQRAITLLLLSLSTLTPVALFAMVWQGSDVERFCLSIPFLSICVSAGAGALSGKRHHSFFEIMIPSLLLICNLSTLIAPTLLTRGGLVTALGRESRLHLDAGDLLILTGQDLGPRVWAPTTYFTGLEVFSILYDVQTSGSDGWKERLTARLRRTVCAGRRVAVLSDLVGVETPGGIGLIPAEYPVPSPAELKEFLSPWTHGETWQVGKYTFIRLLAPPGQLNCAPLSEIEAAHNRALPPKQ